MHRVTPEAGPQPLFFSGGSALREMSRALVTRTHRSTHIVTPFDSGGSSAEIRRAFVMPAVGDLRNRLMALADRSTPEGEATHTLLTSRLPENTRPAELRESLERMLDGSDPAVQMLPEALGLVVARSLRSFAELMPQDFDLRGAAVGNLVLAGGYLGSGRRLAPILETLSDLVPVLGVVRPVLDMDLHLGARLASGREIVGQHLLTGKVAAAPDSPIEELVLSTSATDLDPCAPTVTEELQASIETAALICYPVGSFYTSVVANLLPGGVADAVARSVAPKVYVPNPCHDPEEIGMTLTDKVSTLLRYLRRGLVDPIANDRLLQYVLVDTRHPGIDAIDVVSVGRLGLQIVDKRLVTAGSGPLYDGGALADALLSLV